MHVTLPIVLLFAGCMTADAQPQHASIRGNVIGPDSRPADGANVMLLDGLGEKLASMVVSDGRFELTNVAPRNVFSPHERATLRGVLQKLRYRRRPAISGTSVAHVTFR